MIIPNKEIEINIGDTNAPADTLDINTTAIISNETLLAYYQKAWS